MNFFYKSSALNMKESLSELVSLGNRYAGTSVDDKAKELIANKFKQIGYEVEYEEFDGDFFEENNSWIEIGGDKYRTRASFYAPGTNGEQDVDFFYLDDSRELLKLNDEVAGKFIIIKRHRTETKDHYYDEITHLAKLGAIGCLFINYHPWPIIITLETAYFDIEKRLGDTSEKKIPSLVIGIDDGERIIESFMNGKTMGKVLSNVREWRGKANNVIAYKKGRTDKRIVLYGHRDTAGSPGANDNGSGQVVLLEIAENLKDVEMDYTLEFVSFSGEEHLGSQGSLAYLNKRSNDQTLENIHASVELDMIGYGKIYVINGGFWKDGDIQLDANLTKTLVQTSNEMGYDFEEMFSEAGTPDSGRFASFGVPTTWIWTPDDIHYHSPEDTIEKVDFNNLKAIADVVSTYILKLNNQKI